GPRQAHHHGRGGLCGYRPAGGPSGARGRAARRAGVDRSAVRTGGAGRLTGMDRRCAVREQRPGRHLPPGGRARRLGRARHADRVRRGVCRRRARSGRRTDSRRRPLPAGGTLDHPGWPGGVHRRSGSVSTGTSPSIGPQLHPRPEPPGHRAHGDRAHDDPSLPTAWSGPFGAAGSPRHSGRRPGRQPPYDGRARMIPTEVPRRRNRRGPMVQLPDGLPPTRDVPKYLRLYRHLRDAITSGALSPGQRLPASRTLAEDLQVSRNTVESALDQLRAEGFIVRAVGRGTEVSSGLARALRTPRGLRAQHRDPGAVSRSRGREVLSKRGREVLASDHLITSTAGFTFAPCIPDAATLPMAPWRQILARRSRRWSGADTLPPDPAGYRPLREAIATYLVSSRGVRCDWTQVLVLTSVQQGISLI